MLTISGILQLLTGCQLLSCDVTLINSAETKLMQQNDLSRQETNGSLFRKLAPTVLQRSNTRQMAVNVSTVRSCHSAHRLTFISGKIMAMKIKWMFSHVSSQLSAGLMNI